MKSDVAAVNHQQPDKEASIVEALAGEPGGA